MSIATQITRIRNAREAIKTAICNKGVTVPTTAVLEDLPALITSIPTGGTGGKLYIVGADVITAYIKYFTEARNSINVQNHTVTFTKTSNTDGGAGFSTYRTVDVTDYNKLVMTASSDDVRNTTVAKYIPRIGLTSAYANNLEATYTAFANLCTGGTTSFEERTVELDISAYTGSFYISYTGVASMNITDFHLE